MDSPTDTVYLRRAEVGPVATVRAIASTTGTLLATGSNMHTPSSLRRPLRARVPPDQLPELMDAPDCDEADLAGAMEVLAASGRLFGGDRLLRRRVRRLLAAASIEPGRPLRILDVGAGGGDAAVALHRYLARSGRPSRFILSDLHAKSLAICRRRVAERAGRGAAEFTHVRLDGARLPFADGAFDLALSTTTMHHFADADARAFVLELDRVTTLGWVVTDLRRSPLTLAAVQLLAATAWRRHPFPRADGPASVRRSFTPGEMRRLLVEVGVDRAHVRPRLVRWEAWCGGGAA